MNTKIIALATALVAATTTLTSVAEAGGNGVRLGFGFPMGTFVATPAHGGGYASSPSYGQKAKARAAKLEAARRAAAASKVAKAVDKEKSKDESTGETGPKNSGSTALIETTAPASSSESKTETETSTEASTPASTVAAAPVETPAPEAKTTESQDNKDLSCKKFVPSIGLTVSVACGN